MAGARNVRTTYFNGIMWRTGLLANSTRMVQALPKDGWPPESHPTTRYYRAR